ncbi:hypothetical protein VLK81_06565 [Citroniella saccharovorans]|uniref:Uncharacterized protein n=1 Tax=Citroniella saccharovorans TaxID=2053367 RepID=A0AAW9MUC9_9FIRM|nr:hypothetical protein [Citroniella saccharovorans]MEB3429676.1 hypothetical protein [Citroniella saccharovorans]
MKKILTKIGFSLLIIYVIGALIFSVITYPNTFVHGQRKGLMLKSDALIRENDGRVLTIIGRDKKEVKISPDMFSYKESLKEGEKNQSKPIFMADLFLYKSQLHTRI